MKLTVIIRPREKVEIENVTLFSYKGEDQVLEYWVGQTDLRRLTDVLGVISQDNMED